jgi:hypothetical protein
MTESVASRYVEQAKASLERVRASRTQDARVAASEEAWRVRDQALNDYERLSGVTVTICPSPPVRSDGTPSDLMSWASQADHAHEELTRQR